MLRKIREKRYINKNIKLPLETLISEVRNIRKISDVIMITPQPLGDSWRGVFNASSGFFLNRLLALPQYFSKPIYTDNEYLLLCNEFLQLKFEKIIYSGYLAYFKKLILNIHNLKPKYNSSAEQYIIYHGSFATNAEDDTTTVLLKEIFQLNLDGYVKRIGLIKKGMSETLAKVCGLNTFHLIPMTLPISEDMRKDLVSLPGINIGILTHNLYRKNLHNQVAAALMIENAKGHIHKDYGFDYLYSNQRLIAHPFFESYDDFLQLLGSMTLNFYMSFSECFGLVVTESLSMGVPCLAADNSGLFDYDDGLHEILIVKEFDDSDAIYKQALKVLEHRNEISKKGIEYVKKLNIIAEEKFDVFLNS